MERGSEGQKSNWKKLWNHELTRIAYRRAVSGKEEKTEVDNGIARLGWAGSASVYITPFLLVQPGVAALSVLYALTWNESYYMPNLRLSEDSKSRQTSLPLSRKYRRDRGASVCHAASGFRSPGVSLRRLQN